MSNDLAKRGFTQNRPIKSFRQYFLLSFVHTFFYKVTFSAVLKLSWLFDDFNTKSSLRLFSAKIFEFDVLRMCAKVY